MAFMTLVRGGIFAFLLLLYFDKVNTHGYSHHIQSVRNTQASWEDQTTERSTTCSDTNTPQHRMLESQRIRKRRHVVNHSTGSANHFGRSVYFRGREDALMLRPEVGIVLPPNAFTVEFWVQPEGGQHNPVAIIGLFDTCARDFRNRGWSIGIANTAGTDAKIFFSLYGDRSLSATTILSPYTYKEGRWVHVAAVFDGELMKLYLDGAMVGTGQDQRGALFNAHSRACKEVLLGGDYTTERLFRGGVDELRLWSNARTFTEIRQGMYRSLEYDERPAELLLYESFSEMSLWSPTLSLVPVRLPSSIDVDRHDIEVNPTACGITICDDPDIIRSYKSSPGLRDNKFIRYQVINVLADDGSNPTVSHEQMADQHEALNAAFRPYNITWIQSVVEVRNSSLRQRTILLACKPDRVGNGLCNPECNHERTGHDGGDCDDSMLVCDTDNIGNGVCDSACNRVYHGWDAGDCCNPDITDVSLTCFDPASPYRAFLSIEEYKMQLNYSSDHQLNIFFAEWTVDGLIGLATFPWEKNVFSVLGGTVVRPDSFGHAGRTDNLVHEIGHNLGLWHVHHGISEMDCSDPCRETVGSLEHGDLCQDTSPTPINQMCRDPTVDELMMNTCHVSQVTDTPFDNYMSYAGDTCTDHFSGDQVARMHCYLDLVYHPWQTIQSPSPVPLPPKMVRSSPDSVTLVWVPPMGLGSAGTDDLCGDCHADRSFVQYAYTAWTPNRGEEEIFGAPHQATGPPDATRCDSSAHAWLPEMDSCIEGPCFLEVEFKYPAVPKRLSIWVSWNADDAIEDVELIFTDDSVSSLGSVPAECDKPFTTHLDTQNELVKVRIHVKRPFVAIDAIELLSASSQRQCQNCSFFHYTVQRDPDFSTPGGQVELHRPEFTDSDVSEGETYTYRIGAVLASAGSTLSPPLSYTHGQGYCGDGIITSAHGEDCDDGNVINGDGCDINCTLESLFLCTGEPSHCYRHEGDGVCEEFEETTNIADCGFHSPAGFQDQWASAVYARPGYRNLFCPPDVVIGPPPTNHVCSKTELDAESEWHICGLSNAVRRPWLHVYFDEPKLCASLILYMTVAERNLAYAESNSAFVELIDTENNTHAISQHSTPVNCSHYPLVLDLQDNANLNMRQIKGVKIHLNSGDVGVAAVAMRYNKLSDPFGPSSCTVDEIYNPRLKQCVPSLEATPFCAPLLIKHGIGECAGVQQGDMCRVACGTGYHLATHHDEAYCVNGEWESRGRMECEPVDCGQPQFAYARVDCPDGTALSKRCKFECRSPAERRGTDNVVTCEADGLWSLANSYCHILCPTLPIVKDAELATATCQEGPLPVGTHCNYICDRQFHTSGLTPNDKTLPYTCLPSGEWGGPVCEKTRCPAPASVYMGLYSCTDSFYVDSQCTLKCPGPNRLTSIKTCGSNGEWDSEFEACKFQPGQCPTLQDTGILTLEWSSRNIGDEAQVSCMYPNSDPVLRQVSKRSVEFVGQRVHSPAITMLVCTGSLHWYPDPMDVTCVEQCNTVFIRDTYCDPSNNRAHCGWDGGDCCASTVLGGVVRSYPEDCVHDCECKDPDAEENLIRRELAQEVELRKQRFYSLHIERSILEKANTDVKDV